MDKIINFIKEDGCLEVIETFEHKIVLKTSVKELTSYTDFKDNLEIINKALKKESLKYLESQLLKLFQEYHLIEGDFYLKAEQRSSDMENIYFIVEKDLSKVSIEEVLIDLSVKTIFILEITTTEPGQTEEVEFSDRNRAMECFLNDSYIKELFAKEKTKKSEDRLCEYRVFKVNFKGKYLNERSKDLSKMQLVDFLSRKDS